MMSESSSESSTRASNSFRFDMAGNEAYHWIDAQVILQPEEPCQTMFRCIFRGRPMQVRVKNRTFSFDEADWCKCLT